MDGEVPFFSVRDGLEDTHVEIVRHAACLFGTLGYTKTNIGEIADRVGMSPGNLYRYYRNKQAIGEEVVRCYLTHSAAQMEAAVAAAGPGAEARLRAMMAAGIAGLLDALRENPRMVELANMICAGDSGILRGHILWKIGLFNRLLREGEAEGIWAFDDVDAMAETLLDSTRGFWNPTAVSVLDPSRVQDRVTGILNALMAGWRV